MTINIKPKYALLIMLFILLIAYSLYQARALLIGPRIWVESPQDGSTVENPLVTVEGQSENIAWMSLNDRQIFTDEDGKWSEQLLVSSGLSIMTIKAHDRFGREIKKSVRVVLN
jgi:Glucodextranase, domain B